MAPSRAVVLWHLIRETAQLIPDCTLRIYLEKGHVEVATHRNLAGVGEGRVLPIGGVVEQKVLAAHRAGITEVIGPAANADDLDDVPEGLRQAMTFHSPSTIDEVLAIALA